MMSFKKKANVPREGRRWLYTLFITHPTRPTSKSNPRPQAILREKDAGLTRRTFSHISANGIGRVDSHGQPPARSGQFSSRHEKAYWFGKAAFGRWALVRRRSGAGRGARRGKSNGRRPSFVGKEDPWPLYGIQAGLETLLFAESGITMLVGEDMLAGVHFGNVSD